MDPVRHRSHAYLLRPCRHQPPALPARGVSRHVARRHRPGFLGRRRNHRHSIHRHRRSIGYPAGHGGRSHHRGRIRERNRFPSYGRTGSLRRSGGSRRLRHVQEVSTHRHRRMHAEHCVVLRHRPSGRCDRSIGGGKHRRSDGRAVFCLLDRTSHVGSADRDDHMHRSSGARHPGISAGCRPRPDRSGVPTSASRSNPAAPA